MMQSTSILALALSVLPWAIFGDSPRAQVNLYVSLFFLLTDDLADPRYYSYYDTNCRQYAGTSYTAGGPAVGGPYGAKSMLFATAPNCTELQNRNYGCKLFFRATSFGFV
jgi:hypothetical protein